MAKKEWTSKDEERWEKRQVLWNILLWLVYLFMFIVWATADRNW